MYEAAGRLQGAKSVWLSPIVEFGVYVINNDSLPSPHMIGRAKALKETSTELRGRLRYAVYDFPGHVVVRIMQGTAALRRV